METNKKFFPKKAILYPLAVLVIGFLITVVVLMLSTSTMPGFCYRIGRIIGGALSFAFCVGLASDLTDRKK